MGQTIHLGHVLHVTQNPMTIKDPTAALEHWPEGALVVEGGKVKAAGPAADLRKKYADAKIVNHGDAYIVPGFIDLHIHFPQIDIVGRYSGELLSWLEHHAFPAEMRYAERGYAELAAEAFCRELLHHGTTTSMVFSTRHMVATDVLFQTMERHGCRSFIGKVSMDRNAPDGLLENAHDDQKHTQALIEKWHGRDDRLFYVLTPRFAPSCTDRMMEQHAEFKRAFPSLYIQSHLGENMDEVAWVKELYPNDPNYLSVYQRFGLLSDRTILAHCIYMEPEEVALMQQTKTVAAHCPTSNLFLGSGLFPLRERLGDGMRVACGTDVGGGSSFSMWQTLNEANKIAKLRRQPVSPIVHFYLATLAGAEALSMGDRLGSFAPGKEADFQVLDWHKSRLCERLLKDPLSIEQQLSSLFHTADDRMLKNVYVRGREKLADGRIVD